MSDVYTFAARRSATATDREIRYRCERADRTDIDHRTSASVAKRSSTRAATEPEHTMVPGARDQRLRGDSNETLSVSNLEGQRATGRRLERPSCAGAALVEHDRAGRCPQHHLGHEIIGIHRSGFANFRSIRGRAGAEPTPARAVAESGFP